MRQTVLSHSKVKIFALSVVGILALMASAFCYTEGDKALPGDVIIASLTEGAAQHLEPQVRIKLAKIQKRIENKEKLILVLSKEGCPYCKDLEQYLKQNEAKLKNEMGISVEILRLDETQRVIKFFYNGRGYPQMAAFDDGELKGTSVGYPQNEDITKLEVLEFLKDKGNKVE